MTGAVTWLATWIVMLTLLFVVAQTAWGRTIVYWFLWMGVLLLLVSHADELTSLINTEALQLNG